VNPMLQIQATEAMLPPGDAEPDGQFVHVPTPVAPTILEYELAPQSMHVLAKEAPTVLEYLPAPQSTQELASVAPVVARYLPAPQSVHPAVPVIALYFPAAQAVQIPPFAPVNPTLQIQAVKTMLPPGDTESDGQLVQVPTPVAPTTVEYELAPQSMHVLAKEAPTVAEYLPAPQFTQELATVAPVVVRYLPAPQSVHATAPVTTLYFPVEQAVQGPPFAPVNPTLQIQATEATLPPGDTESDGQLVQVPTPVAPTTEEYELAPQSMHVLAIAAPTVVEYLPAPQSTQELATVAPVVVRYLPAPQLVHATSPVTTLYFPAAHAPQGPPFDPVNPTLQIQANKFILPPGDTESDGQFTQVPTPVAPRTIEYELAPQSIHVLAKEAPTVAEYLPAPQSTQELATVAPVVVRYLPAPQSVHASDPVTTLYFPAAQAVQVPPFTPVNPMLQIQAVETILPPADTEFVGQFVQVPAPVAPKTVEYELTPQSMHVLSKEAPMVVEYLPAPQFTQELAAVAPVVIRYLPAPQSIHASDPVTTLYFPAAQAVQVPPFTPIDRPFIVLTETKFSKRHIPVWARYSPLRTRVEAHANTLSP
jgi:hypothetical protein